VTKPSYVGAFVLSFSREEMDTVIELTGGWKDLNNAFFYTDTDSMVEHSSALKKIERKLGKELGMLWFDVEGKIVKYVCLNPKEYMFWYVKKDGRVMYHKRTKGIPKSQHPLLTMDLFERLLRRRESHALGHADEHPFKKFRRVGFRVPNKDWDRGVRPLGIIIEKIEQKLLNKTQFEKRVLALVPQELEGLPLLDQETGMQEYGPRPDFASLPVGYECEAQPFEEFDLELCELDMFKLL